MNFKGAAQAAADGEPARPSAKPWIVAWLIPIIFGIVGLIYVILLGAFFAYVTKQEQDKLLRQETIAKCLDAGGHIAPGVTCWHENPTDKKQGPLP